ncbi:class I SAM-dependent methyltransferase [Halalkalibacter sp. APA_J-10(15)]|uniref:class I SAM-dependent methyltransferase n=1 Tax=unclassified Halalkalibacter TaxID=2893063 RepID=UPI001FF2C91C|nr:class I SAM-dependent methyltransferase [Halalkalibacter sp. APA_J-10(15)]MCK0471256.1 methyltransferase domain-containing protein [Halalkalibacter sp. APA_J-10(15)]
MNVQGILPFARTLLENTLEKGDIAIDCTVGNGHDTVFLAQLVEASGHVYGFDIQEEAINKTKQRLRKEHLDQVTLFHCGHEQIVTKLPTDHLCKVKAAIFNLGYLPGGDKSIVTQGTTTIKAIKDLLQKMPQGGTIVLVIYHGHPEGKKEKETVESYVTQINQKTAHVLKYQFMNQVNNPPYVIGIEKR